jgi:CheY-like chemotaxis protein
MSMLLSLNGHQTRVAYDGMTALEMAEEFQPQAVLLDIGLPKMNGLEVCRRMRGESWGRTMKIVAVTGWGQDADRQRSAEAGFDHHLVKPVEYSDLEQVLSVAGTWDAG